MAQKRVLKMRKGPRIIFRIFIVLVVIFLFLLFSFLYIKHKITSAGYSDKAAIRIMKEFKIEYAVNNPDNKTLNRAFESDSYKEKNLDKYKQIKFFEQENLIENINVLLEKGYSARDISIILAHGSGSDVTEFAKKDKIKYLEEFFSYDFAKLKYYDRYVNYMNNEGDDEETTIIMVNLDLDKEDYKEPFDVSNDYSLTVLANKHHFLGKNYVPKNLVTVKSEYTIDKDDSTKGRKEAVDAAMEMIQAAKKDGLNLLINSGYRSFDDQKEVRDKYLALYGEDYVKKYVVDPGYSEHQTGLAFDFASGNSKIFKESKEYDWMIKNSYKYGFCYRYLKKKENITGIKTEAWHFRYVGKDVSKVMDEEELSLEEYYAIYVDK
jgi:D-alanyl-D-alanine carboxypeptidase